MDLVSEFVDWVGLDLAKWTHVQPVLNNCLKIGGCR